MDCNFCGALLGRSYHSCDAARAFRDAAMATGCRTDLCMKRCGQCFLPPSVSVEESTRGLNVTIECRRHGHMAMGQSLDMAIAHWNTYVDFSAKAA